MVSMAIAHYVWDTDSWYIYIDMPQPVAWYVSPFKVVSRMDSLCISFVCDVIISKILSPTVGAFKHAAL